MLLELHIHNFAIIDQVDLVFTNHLSVISGETGAGKSIMIDALSILLGARADSSHIRHGQEFCELSAVFEVPLQSDAQQWLQAQSLEDEEQLCHLRRIITHNGRGKCYINGRIMPVQMLREIGSYLIDIHGQNIQQTLLKKEMQRQMLDQFAGNIASITQLKSITEKIQQTQDTINTLKHQAKHAHEQMAFIEFQLQDFKSLQPQPEEWQTLVAQYDLLSKADARLNHFQMMDEYLTQDTGIISQLYKVEATLDKLSANEPARQTLKDLLANARIHLEEAQHEIAHQCHHIEQDPEQLQTLEKRMQHYHELARKHRLLPEELYLHQQQLEQNLQAFATSDEDLEVLAVTLQQLKQQWQEAAMLISHKRHDAAQELSLKIGQIMHSLAMEGGVFHIAFTPSTADFSAYGQENVEFMVSANPGQPLQALQKVASGGELSRISLAIQMILSLQSSLPTMIFDEIDSGVGGAVAELIGKYLQEISDHRQVICVTHLPQVACFGDQHYKVTKQKTATHTHTSMQLLEAKERVAEIARMLGGVTLTAATQKHAEEMCRSAQRQKKR